MVLRLQIYGRVQGVYYRVSTQKKAEELGLVGWVRNRKDGSVEVLVCDPQSSAQKSSAALQALCDWCLLGPPLANVDKVDTSWIVHPETFTRFEVVRT